MLAICWCFSLQLLSDDSGSASLWVLEYRANSYSFFIPGHQIIGKEYLVYHSTYRYFKQCIKYMCTALKQRHFIILFFTSWQKFRPQTMWSAVWFRLKKFFQKGPLKPCLLYLKRISLKQQEVTWTNISSIVSASNQIQLHLWYRKMFSLKSIKLLNTADETQRGFLVFNFIIGHLYRN